MPLCPISRNPLRTLSPKFLWLTANRAENKGQASIYMTEQFTIHLLFDGHFSICAMIPEARNVLFYKGSCTLLELEVKLNPEERDKLMSSFGLRALKLPFTSKETTETLN